MATPPPLSAAGTSSARLPDPIDPEVAVTAFQSQRDVLLTGIHSNLTVVANKLLAKFVITREICEKACNARNGSRERGAYLLGCIQDRIKIVPADFIKVVDILQSEPTLTQLASQLVDSYYNPPPINCSSALSPAISKFADILKTRYRCTPTRIKWPPTPSKGYIQLVLVEGHAECREDYIGHVLEGNIKEVPRRRKICEKDILDLCAGECRGSVMVIQGAPGIGKSMLAWELCRKWEEYASMKVYSLVILLRLREERVHKISTVSELFYQYDREDKKSLTEEIKNNQGKGVLFVLDGFDELPKSLQAGGILTDLLAKECLPKSTIVVTSRPSAKDRLFAICGSQLVNIEILGFTQESIEAYAASVFSTDHKELEGFKSYISAPKNPAINSLMYVPLYAAFIVLIYKGTKSKSSLPRTITQLYTQLCLTILNRHLKTMTEHPSVRRFEDLPDALYKQFLELSELAYEGFTKEEVIFYGDPKEHFGFLDAVPDLFGGCEVSFNFLHLTLQEFFAAYHISQLTDSGVELFKTHGENRRWNVVWRFVAGLTQFKYLESSCPVRYRSFVNGDHITSFFIQCLFEAQSKKIDFLSTFQKKIISCRRGYRTDLDYYALGYCIANCTTRESSWKVSLGYSVDPVMFTQGLMTNTSSTGVIEQLVVDSLSCPNTIEYLHACIENALSSPLSSIIHSAKLPEIFLKLISHMPHLRRLNILNCSFVGTVSGDYHIDLASRGDTVLKLLQHLSCSKVTSLDIQNTGIEHYLPLSQDCCAAVEALIGPSSNLQTLSIKPLDYRKQNETLIRLVSSPSSLRTLTVDVSKDVHLLNNFDPNNYLTTLRVQKWQDYGWRSYNWCLLVPDIVRIIQRSTTLEMLFLTRFNIAVDIDALRDIATAVQGNKTLKQVTFMYEPVNKNMESTLKALDSRITFVILG